MRLIRKETITTTIFNREINDDETIESVLVKLLTRKVDFSLVIRKFFASEYDYRKMEYPKARVKAISGTDRQVDFYVFSRGTVTTFPKVSYDDIVEINANTTKTKILETVEDVTRWDLLDIEA
jgi:hypothetical protein